MHLMRYRSTPDSLSTGSNNFRRCADCVRDIAVCV